MRFMKHTFIKIKNEFWEYFYILITWLSGFMYLWLKILFIEEFWFIMFQVYSKVIQIYIYIEKICIEV